MKNRYIENVKILVLESLKGENVKIILFGSRARKNNNNISDVDIGIIPKRKYDKNKITQLREKIENLNIPYKIDLVDFSHVSEEFADEALKGAFVWKD